MSSTRFEMYLHRLRSADRRVIFFVVCFLEAVVCWLDYFTGPLAPIGPYYFLPLGLATWCLGMPMASLLIVFTTLYRAFENGQQFPAGGWHFYLWDVIASLLIYTTIAVLLDRLRKAHDALGAHVTSLEGEIGRVKRRAQLEATIRRAVPADVDMIVALSVLGAADGDLSKEVLEEVRQHALRKTFAHSIQDGSGPRGTWGGVNADVPVDMWVSDFDGRIAGYFMVMGLDQDKGAERELHAVSVAKEFRGLGVGTAMVDFFCAHYYGRRLYAACKPKSLMHHMLSKRGFYHYANTKNHEYVVIERIERPRGKGLMDETELPDTDLPAAAAQVGGTA